MPVSEDTQVTLTYLNLLLFLELKHRTHRCKSSFSNTEITYLCRKAIEKNSTGPIQHAWTVSNRNTVIFAASLALVTQKLHTCFAQRSCESRRTAASVAINCIVACCTILTRRTRTLVDVCWRKKHIDSSPRIQWINNDRDAWRSLNKSACVLKIITDVACYWATFSDG